MQNVKLFYGKCLNNVNYYELVSICLSSAFVKCCGKIVFFLCSKCTLCNKHGKYKTTIKSTNIFMHDGNT